MSMNLKDKKTSIGNTVFVKQRSKAKRCLWEFDNDELGSKAEL